MKKRISLLVIAGALIGLLGFQGSALQTTGEIDFVPNEMLVQLEPGTPREFMDGLNRLFEAVTLKTILLDTEVGSYPKSVEDLK